MGFIGDAVGEIFGGITGANQAADAATAAGETQAAAAREGIAEQRRQFDLIQELLRPFVTAGTGALSQQGNLIGLNGAGAQSAAIAALQNSPEFQAITQQGENAILQNASATGGLRGGNTQAALGKFRPAVLAQLINDQFNRLGGLTSAGLGAATGTGSAAQSMGGNVSNLLQQQGAALAGGQLAQGRVVGQTIGNIANIAGAIAGFGGFGGLGGGGGVSLIGGGLNAPSGWANNFKF